MNTKWIVFAIISQAWMSSAQASEKGGAIGDCLNTVHYTVWDDKFGAISEWCCDDVPNQSSLESCDTEEGDGPIIGPGGEDPESDDDDLDDDGADSENDGQACLNVVHYTIWDDDFGAVSSWCCGDTPNTSALPTCSGPDWGGEYQCEFLSWDYDLVGDAQKNYGDLKAVTDDQIRDVLADALHDYRLNVHMATGSGSIFKRRSGAMAEALHDHIVLDTGVIGSLRGALTNASLVGIPYCNGTALQRLLYSSYRASVRTFFGDATLSDAVVNEMSLQFTKFLHEQIALRSGVEIDVVEAADAVTEQAWATIDSLLLTGDVRQFAIRVENAHPTYNVEVAALGPFDVLINYAYSAVDGRIVGTVMTSATFMDASKGKKQLYFSIKLSPMAYGNWRYDTSSARFQVRY
jgi:hypothetical protein